MLDPLTLDQLRILVTVVDEGSFSAAARRLRRVQSAISQSIRALEAELGASLFDRGARLPVLTDAGRIVAADAREILGSVELLRGRIEVLAGLELEFSLAVDQMLPSVPLRESVAALTARFPGLPITLFTEGLGGSEQRLRDNQARVAIFALVENDPGGLEAEYLTSVPILPVVEVNHPLARIEGQVSQVELDRHVQLTLADRAQAVSSTAGGTASSRRTWRFADQNTRLEYLLAGFGWSHLPAHMAEPHILGGRLKCLSLHFYDGGYVSFPLHVVHHPARKPGRAGAFFIEDLRTRLQGEHDLARLMGRDDVPAIRGMARRRESST